MYLNFAFLLPDADLSDYQIGLPRYYIIKS